MSPPPPASTSLSTAPGGPTVDVDAIMTPDAKGMTSLHAVGDSADMECGSLNVWATDEKSKTVGCAAIEGTDLYWIVYRSKDQTRISVWQSHNGNSTRGGMSGKVTSITRVPYSVEDWDRIWIDSTSVDGAVVATFERDGAGYDVTISDAWLSRPTDVYRSRGGTPWGCREQPW